MKANYRTRDGRITCEIEWKTQKDLIRGIADLQELLESDSTCGCCESANIHFRVRTAKDGNDYYELVCRDCIAVLSLGQNKAGGGLYPKRKDKRRLLTQPSRLARLETGGQRNRGGSRERRRPADRLSFPQKRLARS